MVRPEKEAPYIRNSLTNPLIKTINRLWIKSNRYYQTTIRSISKKLINTLAYCIIAYLKIMARISIRIIF